MKDGLFELQIDLENISAQMQLAHESLMDGGWGAVPEVQAQAVDGWRRYLNRCIKELEHLDEVYELTERKQKATA